MRNWPLFDLRLIMPDVVLRFPTLEDLDSLADLAVEGVHDPELMPFTVPWTDGDPVDVARNTLQYRWNTWAAWKPDAWDCELVVVSDGEVVGTQAISARDFAVVREVHTGSWLGRRHHGRGLGTQMRAAVLRFAFDGLGAEYACSSAFVDNAPSLAVSRKLGYELDGTARVARRGKAATEQRLRLSREAWKQSGARDRAASLRIEGLERCLPLFGLDAVTDPAPGARET